MGIQKKRDWERVSRLRQSLVHLAGEIRKVEEFTYPWPAEARAILHSDGLASRWDLSGYPGLLRRHPALVAGVLYRDYARGSDDVTVVVAGGPPPGGERE